MFDLAIMDMLKSRMSKKRLEHSIGVARCAEELALQYGADRDKAIIAGLLHDCAKDISKDEMMELVEKYAVTLDDISSKERTLIHGPLGAVLATEIYKIDDNDIIEAIKWHTTGKKGMGILDKILYLADLIEPGRNYEGVERVRNESYRDLDAALLMAFDNTIKYVLDMNRLLHPNTILARNDLILKNDSIY